MRAQAEAQTIRVRGFEARRPALRATRVDFAIFGCGGLGLSAILCAVAVGARVIAADVSAAARQKAKECGAAEVVDASLGADETVKRVLALTEDGIGADVTVDTAGFKATCEAACWSVRRGGRVVQVGLPLGDGAAPVVPMARVANREIEIIGSHGLAAADMPRVLQLVAGGRLRVGELIQAEVSLEEGVRALEAMDTTSPLGITMITRFR